MFIYEHSSDHLTLSFVKSDYVHDTGTLQETMLGAWRGVGIKFRWGNGLKAEGSKWWYSLEV